MRHLRINLKLLLSPTNWVIITLGPFLFPIAPYFGFFLEGLTDYLSVKATQEIIGETQYQQIINRYMESIKSVSNFNPIPLNKIKNASEINERYRYHYVPLMLLAIESELGADQMWKWVQVVLRSEVIKTDYVFFVNSFLDAGVPQAKVDEIVEKYILSESATENIFKALK